jgi:hypothetical protein
MTGYDAWPIGDDGTDPEWEWAEPLDRDSLEPDDEACGSSTIAGGMPGPASRSSSSW